MRQQLNRVFRFKISLSRPFSVSSSLNSKAYVEEHSLIKLATGAELEFLGTSSACSTLTRNVSTGGVWMFDCGEGTVRQMISSTVRSSKLDSVFITHLHGDHIYGLPGLGMRLIGNRPENSKTKLYAPYGLRTFLGSSISANRSFDLREIVPVTSKKALEFAINPIMYDNYSRSYELLRNELFSIKAVPIKHSCFCLGYVIQESDQRGSIDATRLLNEFNIPPGPIFKKLINGESIQSPDGRMVSPEMVMGKPRRARKIVVLGDTFDPSNIIEHAMDADVLVHESTCSNEDLKTALSKGHSTAGMAGEFAKKIRARHLILNHFSPRGIQPNEYEEYKDIKVLIQQAREAFQSEFVYAARDFWRFPVPL